MQSLKQKVISPCGANVQGSTLNGKSMVTKIITIRIMSRSVTGAKDIRKQGVSQITLEATEMGRPLYEKYGFVKMEDEMELIK